MKQYLVLIAFLMSVKVSLGQELWKKEAIKMPPSVCYASPEIHKSFVKPPERLKAGSTKRATIMVDFVGFPEDAKVAFQYAVTIWQDLIYSPVPIHIQATWESLASDVLGSCSPSDYIPNFNSTQIWNCYYPIALVEKMLGQEVNSPTGYEIEASFNKDFTNWYFGVDGNTPIDKYDFVSTVLHELTHGLGFHGFFYSDGRGRGGYGTDGLSAAFDQYVINQNAEKLVNTKIFTNPSVKLYQTFTSGWLNFSTKLDLDSLPRLYAPTTWDSGSSIYHLNDDTYPAGDSNSLMTHAMGKGEANHNPGPNTLAIMYDMGWKSVSIKHTPIKDIEYVTDPINFEAKIESDYDLDSTKLYLIYSSTKFVKKDSVRLMPTSNSAIFNVKIKPTQTGEIQYYFSARDVKKRTFVFPSNSPTRYLAFTIGIDKTAPVITHDPIKFLLSSNPTAKITAFVTDNIGIKSVKVAYFVNGGLIQELALANDSAERYIGNLTFPKGSVKGGDIVSYRIVATDISSQSNIGYLPLTGYNTFKIEEIKDPVERYITNFDALNPDFIGSDFTISSVTGFDSPALNSAHPYLSPDTDNEEFNFSTILKFPIILKNGKMTFDEIALVEPGETGSKFGDENFWDYVIVEGSKDGGISWKPFADGYDSNFQPSWLKLWNSSMSGNNSTAVPTKDLFVKHPTIDMLENGNFSVGDVVLVRFRLFSDPYSHGWGWIIDNLAIQDWETAVNPTLLSSGEVICFPNPVKDQLNIEISAKNTIQKLILRAYNSSGKQVYIQDFPVRSNLFETAIDVSSFIPGLYLFTFEPEKGEVITRKILVQ
ncbi:serine protease [Aquipluma nitroreducens]|uniref:Serine protease n=1 Tax=Aquipluma nitroreducens TaxID=2010828 RepID=A0A5K7S9A3_9BACT|nr:T9SS type A sorting domain-containing protein [Aquipluma nitroreducens]BBE18153.1 serine protease [Aquipluma nitroreducens]